MAVLGGLGPTVIVVTVVETFIATLFLTARFWARIRLLGGLRSDDYLLLTSLVNLTIVTILSSIAATKGFGQHASNLTLEEIVAANKILIVSQSFLVIALLFNKVAIADFLLKIVTEKWHKFTLWFCIFSVSVMVIIFYVLFYARCSDVNMLWDPRVTGKCYINEAALANVNAAYTTFIDFFLAGLPWFFLRKLQMKRKEKLTINLSLSLGVFAGVCGIIRATKASQLTAKSDYTYATVELQLWSTTETTVSIMCLCFPVFRPLWRRYVRGLSKNDSGPFSSKDRGYQLSGRTTTNHGTEVGHTFTVSSGGGILKHSRQPDNESADSILGEDFRTVELGGIKKTRSVFVEYDDPDTEATRSEKSV